LRAFEAMSSHAVTQESAPFYGKFASWRGVTGPAYTLDRPSNWQSLDGQPHSFSGRVLGGCMDTLCKLLGTPYAPVPGFLRRYPGEEFLWTLESCEMNAGDVYRTLWQMRQAGWFERCAGVLVGRPDGCGDTHDFTLDDALRSAFGGMDVPVLTGCDIGHIPPQWQLINGAWATVAFAGGRATIRQEKR
ncbi:MAG: hypothetical protein LBB75_01680, partial [Oscillospiraceae bacterium]|nr:hypothetical protein [Oscillospiraceae bacterium]